MGLLYHIVLLYMCWQSVLRYLYNQSLRIGRDQCLLTLEHLILTNVLIARYTFIAYSVVIIIYICCCRLLDIERMFYINART